MPIVDEKSWRIWEEKNDDAYGKCCVDVAREAMRLIDKKKYKVLDTHKIICKADDNIKAGGITGFMAGCVAQMISKCHSRGEEFRKAWNKDNGIEEKDDKGGVVNPALLTIEIK
ncbi:MAG: hypothetical protein PHY56_00200 [Candidatus Omnitrophica bacterium]|nr:hypothetical protein [Candidatus Omnitrophota bacterium]